MARIVLKDLETDKAQSVPEAEALIGRDPSCAFLVEGPKSKVVSGRHARIFFQDNAWWIEDTSRNGTILDDERLQSGQRHAIRVGQVIGLGESGPRFKVAALETRQVLATIVEPPDLNRPVAPTEPQESVKPTTAPRQSAGAQASAASASAADGAAGKTSAMRRSEAIRAGLRIEESTEPMSPAPDWLVHVVLRATNTNQRFDVKAMTVRLGRSPECNVQIPAEQGASVSRVHAEISIQDGGVSVKDAGSRNGTFLNGKRLEAPHPMARSDLVMLGAGGPTFSVEELHIVKGQAPQAAPADDPTVTPAEAKKRRSEVSIGGSETDPVPARKRATEDPKAVGPSSDLRRSFAGVGRTAFFKDVLEDMSQKSAKRVRYVVWASVAGMIVVAAVILGITQWRVAESEKRMDAERARLEARADSATAFAAAEAGRLRAAMDSAMMSSAPRADIDSLRSALAEATRRTGMLEQSLVRARQSLDQQLAAGDSARRRAEAEMTRLQVEVGKAQSGEGSRAALDSLRRALRSAEEKANDVATQMRAVRGGGTTLAKVSQANQGAVGLIFFFVDGRQRISDGTGFVITRSGYMLTNRHNVADDAGNRRDTLFVTMADQRFGTQTRVTVEAISREYDLALVKIPDYKGPFMEKLDWNGQGASQGEPAALIGFPGGVDLAFEANQSSSIIRTSMSAGIFSKVAADRIQFDGFSVKGSSGSPIFNANGEVVAVHFQGIAGNAGLSFSIPISKAIPLLPPDAKSELGLR